MAIYERSGGTVLIKRLARIEDVQRLEGRTPDWRDHDAVKRKNYVIILQDGGKEALYRLAFLHADGGSMEIMQAIQATRAR